MNNNINHPSHYTRHPSGIECIEIAQNFGFALGCVIKYVFRAGSKNSEIEDIKKALWYAIHATEIGDFVFAVSDTCTNLAVLCDSEPNPNKRAVWHAFINAIESDGGAVFGGGAVIPSDYIYPIVAAIEAYIAALEPWNNTKEGAK